MPSAVVVHNGVVVPVEPRCVVHDPGWVRIEGGRIASVGAGRPASTAGERLIDARGGLVLPGLVSVHQHVLDILLRGGVPMGTTFGDWLFGLYYGGISAYRPTDAGVATLLGAVETIRAGVTCVVDNWGVCSGDDPSVIRACADASLAAYSRSGLRVLFACMFATQLPVAWRQLQVRYDPARLTAPLDVAMAWIAALQHDYGAVPGAGRITVSAAPELPEMVGAEGLAAAGEVARWSSTIMATHLLASPLSRQWADAAQLADLGAFQGPMLGAHCTYATPGDLAVLAEHRVAVAHCPTANAALGRMVSAAPMRAAGLSVGLGSDNASLNRNSDILAEARRAVMAARIFGSPDEWIDTHAAVEMATIEGARAIGMGDRIGSLMPGKQGDLIVIDTAGAHWWPRHDWLDTLVSQGKSSDVRTVVIGGDIVLDDGVLSFLDPDQERRLTLDAQAASLAVVARAGLA